MTPRVWYVNVYVFDLEEAVEFYRDRIGLPLRFMDEEFGYASFGTDGAGFALARVDRDSEQAELVGRHTGVGLAVADLDAVYADLCQKGVEFTMPPTRQAWGGVLSMFRDPDGNVLFLDQLREES